MSSMDSWSPPKFSTGLKSRNHKVKDSQQQHDAYDMGQFYLGPGVPSTSSSGPSSHQACSSLGATLPSMEDLDVTVIESLPPDLFSEINDLYGGKLIHLISNHNNEVSNQSMSALNELEGNISKQETHASAGGQINNIREKDEVLGDKEILAESAFGSGVTTLFTPLAESENVGLMPSSLSQVDVSILQKLPEELRADIVGALPAHRSSNCLTASGSVFMEARTTRVAGNPVGFMKPAEDTSLWVGNPPYWVCNYKASNCLMLNILAEMHLRSGSIGQLSSTLQYCLSGYQIFSDVTEDVAYEASKNLSELLRQYIRLKLETDIEEIYVCFRLLRRLTLKSKVFSRVYSILLPYVQASVGESYGGNLHLDPMC